MQRFSGRKKESVIRMPDEGEVIARRYRIVRTLGSGGMGTVYEAVHVDLGQRVAIKVLAADTLATPDAVARFRREARVAAQLRSRHVAKVLDVDTTESGLPFMVLELLEGNDLSAEVARGALPVRVAVDYARQALEALGEAHSYGIVHRDIKPANLFVCSFAPGASRRVVKILDFGIAKSSNESDRITQTFDSFGTPEYMSPEQIRATRDVDARSDIWSVAIVLYECLTGRVPFTGTPTNIIASIVSASVPPPRTLAPDVPPGLEAVIMKALQKDETKRYQSAEHFRNALAIWAPTGELFGPTPPSVTAISAPLGTVLVQNGVITADQLLAALDRQRAEPGRRLGEVLVESGACSADAIEAALRAATRSGGDAVSGEPAPTRKVDASSAAASGTAETALAAAPTTDIPISATRLAASARAPSSSSRVSATAATERASTAAERATAAPEAEPARASQPGLTDALVASGAQEKLVRRTALAGFVGALLAIVLVAVVAVVIVILIER